MIGLEPIARGADLLDVDQARARLDLRFDADARLATGRLLDLGEQQIERVHVGRAFHLREHQLVEPLRRTLDHLDHVA
jgi:hypothetical protein